MENLYIYIVLIYTLQKQKIVKKWFAKGVHFLVKYAGS